MRPRRWHRGWSDGEYRYWGLSLRPGWFIGVVRMIGAGDPATVLAPYRRTRGDHEGV